MLTRTPSRGLFFVALAAVAWGSGGIVAAILYRNTGLGPVAVSFWRTLIGTAVLALAYRRPSVAQPRRWGVVLTTGVGLAVYQTAYYAAIAVSGAAFATVLTLGTIPVLIALLSWVILGERLNRAGLMALAAAPVGLLLVTGGAHGSVAGIGLSLLSAAGCAAITVLYRALRTVDTTRTTVDGFIVATLCLAPLALWEGLWPARVSVPTALLLAYLGIFSSAVAYSLYFVGLRTVRATTASIVALVEPLTAAGLAVLLLGEPLTPSLVLGAAVLFSAVGLLARAEARQAPTPDGREPPTSAGGDPPTPDGGDPPTPDGGDPTWVNGRGSVR